MQITAISSGDRKLVALKDLSSCAPAATPGKQYVASAWYKSTTPVRFAAYTRSTSGTWVWWAQSAEFPATSIWTQVRWTTPAVPAGVDGISVGLSIRGVGSMTVDDHELLDPSAGTAIAGGKSAGTGASAKNASAPAEIVSRVPVLGEDGENEYDEAAFAEATSAERTTLTDATGCSSGGAGLLSLALMAAALAFRARARRRIGKT